MRIAPDVVEMASAVDALSATGFAVRGRVRTLAAEAPRVTALAEALYDGPYTRSRPGPARPDRQASRDLIAALSAANTGQGSWEAGWTLKSAAPDRTVVVEKGGLTLWVRPELFRLSEAALGAAAGGQVCVGKERQALMPGYYMALGDACEDGLSGAPDRLVRLYWHATPAGAAAVCRRITAGLNEASIPFRLKLLDHPAAYLRADTAILYIRKNRLAQAGPPLAEAYQHLSRELGDELPRMTRRLAPGLGLAEDPGGDESFGQHRCRLIAEALWAGFENGAASLRDRIEAVAHAFTAAGLDPARPHLQPGSADDYDALLFSPRKRKTRGAGQARRPREGPSPLAAAAAIGDDLCRQAYWHDGRCNWLGHPPEEMGAERAAPRPTVSALGPDLYGGTAGVALFLGQLHALAGEAALRRTAEGAIRHALFHADDIPNSQRLGLYTGALGVSYAAERLGQLLDQDALLAPAAALAARATADLGGEHTLGMLGGNAGAICALLGMRDRPNGDRLLEAALALGDEILAAATRRDGRCCWDNQRATGSELGPRPLTGFSHGAAGIALALMELHACTGRSDFLECALGAVAYEDDAFSPAHDNWPDFRAPAEPSYMAAWCHGSPGIGLARLRALELLPGRRPDLVPAIEAALRGTTARLDALMPAAGIDATPCHGLAGLVELLLVAADVLPKPELVETAARAWQGEIAKRATSPAWTTGVPSGGFNPSLMVGTAGIGYGLLRLHDRVRVPSVLMPAPRGRSGIR